MSRAKCRTYRLVTLGCRTNQYETQAYQTQLEALGYEVAAPGEGADLCIINTCTVTASADRESKRQIRRLIRANPGARIAVTGCAVEGRSTFVEEVEGITDVVPNQQKEQLIAQLHPEIEELPEFAINQFEGHTRAFVKVQDGCNSFCTYCIIPYVRGRSRSRTIPEVLDEVRGLIAAGYKEVVLTGINIGDFDGGAGGVSRLAELVRAVDQVPGLERLRISSIDPDEVDEELTDAVLNGEHTCPSMHIVLQAGSNVVLKRMNRKYTQQLFMETIERLRDRHPDFTFTTDVIVGFPGETERDFEATLAVMEQVQFAKVHMFPYSDRPRTRAALYKDKVEPALMRERKDHLLRLAERQAYALRENFIGRQMEVLTEGRSPDLPTIITGHTANFLPVMIESPTLQPNQSVMVDLVENRPGGFVAYAHRDRRTA